MTTRRARARGPHPRRVRRRIGVLPAPLEQVDRTWVWHHHRKLAYFGGCDYFRLASHPAVGQALRNGLREHGLSVSASRATTGNHRLYGLLESRLAEFFRASEAVLVANGYLTNPAVTQTLAGRFSHALIDERAHSSLVDAARFLDCPTHTFPHRDASAMAEVLRRLQPTARPILLTDGLFAHDGSVAPLRLYRRFLPRQAWLLVDDAHGAGILGRSGRGALEFEGVGRARIIQTITLSKAFGVYGGAILTNPTLAAAIRTRSRLFRAQTPLPLPLAQAALTAVQIVGTDPSLRRRLADITRHVKSALRTLGLSIRDTPGPIVSVVPRRAAHIECLRRRCVQYHVFPSFIHYPGVGATGYFRFALSSEHTPAQIDALLQALFAYRQDIENPE